MVQRVIKRHLLSPERHTETPTGHTETYRDTYLPKRDIQRHLVATGKYGITYFAVP